MDDILYKLIGQAITGVLGALTHTWAQCTE